VLDSPARGTAAGAASDHNTCVSMTRSDTGPGACEVMLVEQVEAW
jgi:hypothetical protein